MRFLSNELSDVGAMKPYLKMKESGVEWLGKVPEHWPVRRLKSLCSRYALYGANVNANSYSDDGIRFLRTTDITEDGRLRDRGVFLPEGLVREYLLADGDILISRSGTIGRSFLYESRRHGPCAYAGYLVRFIPGQGVLPEYVFLFTKTQAFAEFLRVKAVSSTIDNVSAEKYANSPLPLPPLHEQAAIVRFLKRANRRIRRYIRAKQKLISLLEELKQAIIHQAVTGQIDVRTGRPYPSYRESGVEWLGDVPDHWEVRRIGGLAKVGNGSTPARSNQAYWSDGSYPWLNSSSVNQGRVAEADQFVTETALRECHLPRVPADSVLVGITGQGKTRGMAAVLVIEATINQHLAYMTPRSGRAGLTSGYLHTCLTAAYTELRAISRASGSTKGALTCEDIKSFSVTLPPMKEQEAVLLAMRISLAPVENCVDLAKRQIELLKRYRARLVSDVVTGKLDVREAAGEVLVESVWAETEGNFPQPRRDT